MDRNPNNKVYINPNFQRTPLTNAWSFQHTENTNFYRPCSQQTQKYGPEYRFGMEQNMNRKIYVNPNFKQIKQEPQPIPEAQERHEKVENVNAHPVLISKSRYSLVSNSKKNIANKSNNHSEDRPQSHSLDSMQKDSCIQKVLNNNKYPNGIPVIKSRYTIVRKKKMPAENQEVLKQDSNPTMLATNKTLSFESSQLNSNDDVPKKQENIIKNKQFENITKIKISKYKTIPATYLKKNIPSNNDFNSTAISQSHTTGKFSFNINTHKPARSSSKTIIEGNPSKTIPKTGKKSHWPNQSKTKLLKPNFKVNNIPCRLFIKYGKCLRKDYGNCEYVHDKKHVSLCRKFLKGICHDSKCALSHELTANKMPTCYFYLNGNCTKDNCPYLHIKLNEKTKICHNFLRGYCENGDRCQFRHVKINQCKKTKVFNINSCNRYKNISSKSIKLKTAKTKCNIKKKDLTQLNNKKNIKECNMKDIMDTDCRYYKEKVTNEGSCKNIKPTRCKIGTLPSFIQF